MAIRIPVLSRGKARFCGRCGSAVSDDGSCAGCVAREQARKAFIIPRPSQLGHGSAIDPADDLPQPISEPRSSWEGPPTTIGLGERLAALRGEFGPAAAAPDQTPDRSPARGYDEISRGLGSDHPVASADQLTASEYRAILAEHRRATASPDRDGHAERVIRTPALRQPSSARKEAQRDALPSTSGNQPAESTGSPPIQESVQILVPDAVENVALPSRRPRKAKATARGASAPAKQSTAPRRRRSTTGPKRASVVDSSVAARVEAPAPAKESAAPRRKRSTTGPKRASVVDSSVVAKVEAPAPAKESAAPRRKRSTTGPKRASVVDSPVAANEATTPQVSDSRSILVAWAVGHDAESIRRGGTWRRGAWVVIVCLSAVIGASVPILLMR